MLSWKALVHPCTRMRHLSDAFHKVRTSVSLRRNSISRVELPRECGRKKAGTHYLQEPGQQIRKIQGTTNDASVLTCSSCTPFHVWVGSKPCSRRIRTPWVCSLTSPGWNRGRKERRCGLEGSIEQKETVLYKHFVGDSEAGSRIDRPIRSEKGRSLQ